MSEETRNIIRAYVDRHGRAKVAQTAFVSEATVINWLRPASNRAHTGPSAAAMALLVQRFGDAADLK